MELLKRFKLIMWLLSLVLLGLVAFGWYAIPETALVPIHWNAQFQADGWTSRNSMLGFGVFFVFFVPALYWLILKIEPRKRNLEQSLKAYRYAMLAIQAFFVLVFGGMVLIGAGFDIQMNHLLPLGLGLLFIVLGNYMGKVRSNFMFGIRTPWTLSSDEVWNKTHRLGGRVFVGLGLFSLLFIVLDATQYLTIWLIAVGISTLFIVFYSWWCFQKLERQ